MLTTKIDGEKQAARKLRKVRRAVDPDRVIEAIAPILGASTSARFKQQKTPAGKRWPRSRAGRAERRPTLVPAGRKLAASIRTIIAGDRLIIGTPYPAHQHQFGSQGRNAVPARPFLGLSDSDQEAIGEVIGQRLRSATR